MTIIEAKSLELKVNNYDLFTIPFIEINIYISFKLFDKIQLYTGIHCEKATLKI